MRASSVAAARAVIALLCLAVGVAAAQQPQGSAPAAPAATQPGAATQGQPAARKPQSTYGFEDEASAQQQQQLVQPLNNKPVWDIVRSGQPQTTQVRGRETAVLIQPEGQTWRALRNGQLSMWGGWGIVLIIIAITAWHLYRGMIPLHGPRTGHLIRRFTLWERVIHWITAASWVILAVSGLIILFGKNGLLPLIGYTLFSWLAVLSKNLHNFTGPIFVVTTVLVFLTFLRDNFWRAYDWVWVRRFGGMLSGHEVPSGKYNAGEKIWFWLGVLLLGVVVSASGLVLDFPNFNQTRATMQIADVVHVVAASLFIMMGLGHIYIGTIGMEGAYDAMRTGYVDETWAREHHEYWYNDVAAGRVPPSGDVIPPPIARPA